MINAIKFSIEEIEASDQYFDHTGFGQTQWQLPNGYSEGAKVGGLGASARRHILKSR